MRSLHLSTQLERAKGDSMMEFYSTRNHSLKVDLKTAVLRGLADDGGLYMPTSINALNANWVKNISEVSFQEIACEIAHNLLPEIPLNDLKHIVEESITFDAPLIALNDKISTLELFHGPTLSFKDFGARFMAKLMAYLIQNDKEPLHILVATSGDTGSAVAHGFLNAPGIHVWVLYPKEQVSPIQEKQLTTIGHNVTAIEVEGTFDDCQALVKKAFLDKEVTQVKRLSSANSINIARLIPQSFYYAFAYAQCTDKSKPLVISVPSGNFGNLTAGLIAKRMGIPVQHFIASTNINDTVPHYLETGEFLPKASKQTVSNAMDVGNPSNFDRILDLYDHQIGSIRNDISGYHFNNDQTIQALKEIKEAFEYIADPHGAIGYLGLKAYLKIHPETNGIFLETAHPAKFLDTVEKALNQTILLPPSLNEALYKEKQSITMSNDYEKLKLLLLA